MKKKNLLLLIFALSFVIGIIALLVLRDKNDAHPSITQVGSPVAVPLPTSTISKVDTQTTKVSLVQGTLTFSVPSYLTVTSLDEVPNGNPKFDSIILSSKNNENIPMLSVGVVAGKIRYTDAPSQTMQVTNDTSMIPTNNSFVSTKNTHVSILTTSSNTQEPHSPDSIHAYIQQKLPYADTFTRQTNITIQCRGEIPTCRTIIQKVLNSLQVHGPLPKGIQELKMPTKSHLKN